MITARELVGRVRIDLDAARIEREQDVYRRWAIRARLRANGLKPRRAEILSRRYASTSFTRALATEMNALIADLYRRGVSRP